VKFVSTLAPAWEADKRPIYGGFFWINGDSSYPVPHDAYYMAGVGGQTTLIVPSHDLVVVRLGHYRGAGPGGRGFRQALSLLMEAVEALVLYVLPMPRGAPTARELVVADTGDFEAARARLVALVEPRGGPSRGCAQAPPIRSSDPSRAASGAARYKHMDHHLRQFGV
jgi:CubicO group peptidase (beta-lactamase class C family)